MKVTINIPDQVIIDSISTALEGGSNYWYNLPVLSMIEKTKRKYLAETLFISAINGAQIPVEDIDEFDEDSDDFEAIGYISKENIERGIQLYIENENRLPTDDDPLDAEEADIFFQYIVLGEIVYG